MRREEPDYHTEEYLIAGRTCYYTNAAGKESSWKVPMGPSSPPEKWALRVLPGTDVNFAAQQVAGTLPSLSDGQWHVGFRLAHGGTHSGPYGEGGGHLFFFLWHQGEAKDMTWTYPGNYNNLRVLSEQRVRMARVRAPASWAKWGTSWAK